MFVSIESFFVLKYNRYHTNKILCFNSFEYFIGFFFLVIYSDFLAFFESVEEIYFDNQNSSFFLTIFFFSTFH
jgi:hypothetical protein